MTPGRGRGQWTRVRLAEIMDLHDASLRQAWIESRLGCLRREASTSPVTGASRTRNGSSTSERIGASGLLVPGSGRFGTIAARVAREGGGGLRIAERFDAQAPLQQQPIIERHAERGPGGAAVGAQALLRVLGHPRGQLDGALQGPALGDHLLD